MAFLRCFAVVAAFAAILGGLARPGLAETDAAARRVTIDYKAVVENLPADASQIGMWIPIPYESGWQTLHGVSIESPYPHQQVREKEHGNRFLRFDLSSAAGKKTATVRIRFDVTRRRAEPVEAGALSEAKRKQYLSAARLVPTQGPIAEEAKRVAGHLEDPLQQARALYDHVVETVDYRKEGEGWGRGDAVRACNVRYGNCTDFHSLFIGEARALQIPARFIMGLPVPRDKQQGRIGGYHCWAEFHVAEKGWLPVDASEAHKHPARREELFGGLGPHRVAFTRGRDLQVPGMQSGPLNYAVYPHVEVDGKEHEDVTQVFRFAPSKP
jgi:transglutaminase-like putative cysteine protease